MFAKARKRQPESDWYWAASPEDRKEYDAFGPWVDNVRSAADMPPRFRAAYGTHRNARFLLKVPVAADRLQMRPGMNLYRQVIAVHDDHISVLGLVGGAIVTRTISWDDVAAIRSYTNLLLARWTLLLRDGGSIAVDYNSVSSRRLDAVTDFIRSRLTPDAERPNVAEEGASVEVADYFFQSMLFAVRHSLPRPVMLLHFEPRDRLCRDAENHRRLSTGLMILDAADELVIVDRGAPARRFFHPTYAAGLIYIPYARLTAFRLPPPPPEGRVGFRTLRLVLDRQVIDLPCLMAPDRVVARLVEHGIRRAAPA